MKMKFNHTLLVAILLVLFLGSCSEDFLVEEPRLSQSNELTLSSYKGLNLATIGAYSRLVDPGWYGADILGYGDMRGGTAKKGSATSGRYINEYFWNLSPASTSGLWSEAYYTISRCNNVINVIEDGFTETGVTQAQLDEILGECLFIRALAYFDLARQYCLPYSLDGSNMGVAVVTVTENGYPARENLTTTYTRVVDDLLAAIAVLPDENSKGTDRAWADIWTAKALLARVYLYMEDWANAAAMATDVIDNGGFTMFTEPDMDTYLNGGYWGGGAQYGEIIFQVDGSEGNTDHGYWLDISYMTNPDGAYGDFAVSIDVINLFDPADARMNLFYTPAGYPGEYWTLKYVPRLGQVRESNFPAIRLSEMYLIRAEAVREGATGDALADWNMIRTNRGLAPAVAVTTQDIYDERVRELNFEGHQFFDLARTQRGLVRSDYGGVERGDVPFVVGGSAADNKWWAAPIPQAEIDANENMVQNPL